MGQEGCCKGQAHLAREANCNGKQDQMRKLALESAAWACSLPSNVVIMLNIPDNLHPFKQAGICSFAPAAILATCTHLSMQLGRINA